MSKRTGGRTHWVPPGISLEGKGEGPELIVVRKGAHPNPGCEYDVNWEELDRTCETRARAYLLMDSMRVMANRIGARYLGLTAPKTTVLPK